jgi:hypothetical protein
MWYILELLAYKFYQQSTRVSEFSVNVECRPAGIVALYIFIDIVLSIFSRLCIVLLHKNFLDSWFSLFWSIYTIFCKIYTDEYITEQIFTSIKTYQRKYELGSYSLRLRNGPCMQGSCCFLRDYYTKVRFWKSVKITFLNQVNITCNDLFYIHDMLF